MRASRWVVVILVVVVVAGLTALTFLRAEPEPVAHYAPADLAEAARLDERAALQQAAAADFGVFHGFAFTDAAPASGITFQHKMVDDGGKAYKMVHYDHGNGLSVADVDGDGRLDVYFVNQVGANGLWRNRGDGTFEDLTDASGTGMPGVVSVAAAFADVDNDGDPDLYVTTVRYGNRLFENDGAGRFTDVTERAGVGVRAHSSGAVFFDYDRDGLLDLFVTNVGQYTRPEEVPVAGRTRFDDPAGEYRYYVGFGDSTMGQLIPERDELNRLFHNAGGGRFEDVTERMGVGGLGWSGDATLLDANDDGWMDLYVLNMQGDDEYYENLRGEGFALRTQETFGKTPYGAMGVEALDFNNDGQLDLYLTDMHSDMWETNQFVGPGREKMKPRTPIPTRGRFINGNALFQNYGADGYLDVADLTGTETYWPWGVSAGDLNADGFEDLFVTGSMNYPFRYAVNSVLLNDRGATFRDSEFLLGVEPRRDGRTAKVWFEVDCAAEDHAACGEAGAEGPMDVYGALGSRSSVVFDLEGDGDLDVITNEFNDGPMVLVSDLSDRRPVRYLGVDLVGTASNRDALGALVRVHAGDRTFTQRLDGKSGYLSQSAAPLYFGLGDAETVDRVEVMWPSGARQTIPGPLAPNQMLVVEEE